jgi:hypothetical protein
MTNNNKILTPYHISILKSLMDGYINVNDVSNSHLLKNHQNHKATEKDTMFSILENEDSAKKLSLQKTKIQDILNLEISELPFIPLFPNEMRKVKDSVFEENQILSTPPTILNLESNSISSTKIKKIKKKKR